MIQNIFVIMRKRGSKFTVKIGSKNSILMSINNLLFDKIFLTVNDI